MIFWWNLAKATVFVFGGFFCMIWCYDIIFNRGHKEWRYYKRTGFWRNK